MYVISKVKEGGLIILFLSIVSEKLAVLIASKILISSLFFLLSLLKVFF